jgi:hypothetical protein
MIKLLLAMEGVNARGYLNGFGIPFFRKVNYMIKEIMSMLVVIIVVCGVAMGTFLSVLN